MKIENAKRKKNPHLILFYYSKLFIFGMKRTSEKLNGFQKRSKYLWLKKEQVFSSYLFREKFSSSSVVVVRNDKSIPFQELKTANKGTR